MLYLSKRDPDEFSRIKKELNENTPLRCILKPIPLDGKRCFEVISHTWGDPTPTREIILNDKRFLIPEKAYHGLLAHRIRRREGYRHGIWLDSICLYLD
ncbi:hypothetical protein BDZ45DRAFT_672010 [Acephala macrosclerotiorum]|nr:hypothetical protein BDZ45DRAFT_672010 [Acephala macrosclerotiorum]